MVWYEEKLPVAYLNMTSCYIMAAFTITICQILILYLQSVGGHFDSCQLVQLDDTHIPARQPFNRSCVDC